MNGQFQILVNGLRNNKLTEHQATLQSHAKAFVNNKIKSKYLVYSHIEKYSIVIALKQHRHCYKVGLDFI